MKTIYVAPSGNDEWPGSIEKPLASLAKAQEMARSSGSTMIDLRAGRHVLTEPLVLTAADSGTTFRSYDEEPAILSGGRRITEWQRDGDVWRAEAGVLEPRVLIVDGRRADRAVQTAGIPGDVSRTETGYVTDVEIPQSWKGSEFVYTGVYPWTEARIGVADVARTPDGTAITMTRPAFDWALRLYRSESEWTGKTDIGLPTSIENSRAFLTEPGTFVLDTSTPGVHVLYYKPHEDEDPEQTMVIAPAIEQLVVGSGARGISLQGLTFAHTTWSRPGSPEGFLHYHGCGYYDGGEVENLVIEDWNFEITVPGEGTRMVPSAIVFEDCSGIDISDCRFTLLGANALEFLATKDILVRRNTVADISGGGILVGSETQECLIEDNLINRIGREFRGSPAVNLTATRDVSVVHNEIREVPHVGVVVNGGESASGARIEHNLIERCMLALADGGGIYLTHPQGSSSESGATVRGNVVLDAVTPYNFALYADYGACWVTFRENVVGRADKSTILEVWPALDNVAFVDNIWDAEPEGSDSPPEGVTLTGNRVVAADALDADPTAAEIIRNAGTRDNPGGQ